MARLFKTPQAPTPQGVKGTGRLFGTTPEQTSKIADFRDLAEKAGLGEQAGKIIASKGEKPKEIFSGGVISDTFDVLNTLQYGVVGTLQGKGWIEGVRTRSSFTDKDQLGDKGIPGVVAGFALDIALDPLTYISPKAFVKVGALVFPKVAAKVVKGAKAISIATKNSRIGSFFGRKFIYGFGQDKVYKDLAERTYKSIGIGNENLLNIARPLTKLDSAAQIAIGKARKAGTLGDLPLDILNKAKPAFDELDKLGKEAVKVGLLKREVYDANVGKYLARLYQPRELAAKTKGIFPRKPLRIDLSRFMKRKDIPEEVRIAMGEILEAGYPTAKSLVQLNRAVENAKFFNEVAKKWGSDILQDGLAKLSDTRALGQLAGKYVPKAIFDSINEIIRPIQKGFAKKAVAGFKFGKVIMNPATHGRNIISNFILNSFEGLSPARLDIYVKAAKQIIKKGDLYKEAKAVGLGLDTFAAREIKELLIGGDAPKIMSKLGKGWRKVVESMSNAYQKEEEFAKMAQYIFQKSKGLSPEKAWEIAERATFNYAQVTPFIRKLRENIFGLPFITFTAKVTPQVVRTLAIRPTRISNIGKLKTAIESLSGIEELTRERASEPDWIKDGFYVKLPIKDKHGRSAYFDLTYIMPFGDLLSGQFLERGIKRETGLPESIQETLLKKPPLLRFISEIVKNQDFFGNKLWKESDSIDKQLGDLMRHTTKAYLPPLIADQIPGGYRRDGTQRPGTLERVFDSEGIEQGRSQSRTLMQEMLRNIGLKTTPVDVELQEKYKRYEIEKGLKTLLEEAGALETFEITFIPKEKKTGTSGRLFR